MSQGGDCAPRCPSSPSSEAALGLSRPPSAPQEFEIELEGSQSLRILCYEKCYDKTKLNKDNNEIVDKIMGKGQIQVCVGAFGHLFSQCWTSWGRASGLGGLTWGGAWGGRCLAARAGSSGFGSGVRGSQLRLEDSEVGGHQVSG